MGLFDLPAPIFAWVDAQAAAVAAPGFRLVLWGTCAAAVTMAVYGLLSAQERIRRGRVEIAEARRQLDSYDGEWDGALPLLRRLLRLAFVQVGRVGWPTLIASLPLLSLLAWLSTAYGYAYPPAGAAPAIATNPPGLRTQWIEGTCRPDRAAACPDALGPRILVFDGATRIAEVPLSAPVPVVHKRRWWNALLHNPAGYLGEDAALDSLRVELPAREYLSFGPRWGRMWATLFFVPLILVSLGLKRSLRIA